MHIALAPMEGVVDYLMRQLLTEIGGFDLCVTEFVRVSDTVFPDSVFYRYCPELRHGSQTLAGVPVHIQLLGNHPQLMAENAHKAWRLGAKGIDINFGCPARTVNKNKGGAALLVDTEILHTIVKAIREAVPADTPVTAKMRLGLEDKSLALDNAVAIAEAGAENLTVHARTKVEGYKPPAHWEWITRIREKIDIPVTANGDIWTPEDYDKCRQVTGCEKVMVGRGALTDPFLARNIKQREAIEPSADLHWLATRKVISELANRITRAREDETEMTRVNIRDGERYLMSRMKQWLALMSKRNPQAAEFFQQFRLIKCPQQLLETLLAA
ncbi:tRNA dihydrouridine synthase [Endozoicomonadaceae bacterium StTr2]